MISRTQEIPDSIKQLLTEETQKILDNLLSHDQTKIEEICQDIIPSLLKWISEYEDWYKEQYSSAYDTYDNQQQQYHDQKYKDDNRYNNDYNYVNDDYSYGTNSNKDHGEKDNYDNKKYYDDTLTLEKFKEILRNIAYAIC